MGEELPSLTARQWQIIELMRQGFTTCESIATQLGISPNTVTVHRTDIYRRLGVNNALEMILKLYDLKEKEKTLAL
jgi:DNA-binding NarL/FixJ family response regulator